MTRIRDISIECSKIRAMVNNSLNSDTIEKNYIPVLPYAVFKYCVEKKKLLRQIDKITLEIEFPEFKNDKRIYTYITSMYI